MRPDYKVLLITLIFINAMIGQAACVYYEPSSNDSLNMLAQRIVLSTPSLEASFKSLYFSKQFTELRKREGKDRAVRVPPKAIEGAKKDNPTDALNKRILKDVKAIMRFLKLKQGNINRFITEEIKEQRLSLNMDENVLRAKIRQITIEAIINEIGWEKFRKLNSLHLLFAIRNVFRKNIRTNLSMSDAGYALPVEKRFDYERTAEYSQGEQTSAFSVPILKIKNEHRTLRPVHSGANGEIFDTGDTVLNVRREANTTPDIKTLDGEIKLCVKERITPPVLGYSRIEEKPRGHHFAVEIAKVEGMTIYQKKHEGSFSREDAQRVIDLFDAIIRTGKTFSDYKDENIMIGKIAGMPDARTRAYYVDMESVMRNDTGMPEVIVIIFLKSRVENWGKDFPFRDYILRYLESKLDAWGRERFSSAGNAASEEDNGSERHESIELMGKISLMPIHDPELIKDLMKRVAEFSAHKDLAVKIHAERTMRSLQSNLDMLYHQQRQLINQAI